MTVAAAQNDSYGTFVGSAAGSHVANNAGSDRNAAAQAIAAFALSNMHLDNHEIVVSSDLAHRENMKAIAGLTNAAHNFAFTSVDSGQKAAPSTNVLTDNGGRSV